MSDYNKGQQALIDAPADRKAIGVAGAGTGKTTTILARTKKILTESQTGYVLLITFTRAAANDMKNRLTLELNPQVDENALPFQDENKFIDMRRIMSGTFHSVIGTFIRRYAVEVGLSPNFSVIDENSTNIMYRNLIEANPLHVQFLTKWALAPNEKKLAKKHFNLAANTASMLVNAATPSELKDGNFSKETLYQLTKTHTTITDENVEEVAGFVYKLFKESIVDGKRTNTITYDQILFIGYLMAEADMLATERQAFVHTIVDEYQDTNPLQDAFIRYFAGEKLTIVGDVDQSIYGFRGGRPTLILDHAEEEGTTVYNLTMNYRSGQDILDSANRIIKHNKVGSTIRKDLEAGRENPHPGIVEFTVSTDDHVETQQIIQDIKYLREKGTEWYDMAILIRSRMTLPEISKELKRANIPVYDTTKYADFMKSDVMVDTLNFLKVFVNPKDIYAFMGVIDRPKQGIGPATLAKLQDYADKKQVSLVEYLLSKDISELTPNLKKKVEKFVGTYESVFQAQNNDHVDLEHLVGYIFESFGYETWLMGLKNNERYQRDLITLRGVIRNFEEEFRKEHKNPTLFDIANAFVFDMSSVSVAEEDKDGVCITTVHNAKGLEWKYVFLVGFEQENFPGNRIEDEEDMESERRLAYVAFTRAKDILRVFAAQNRICFGDQKLTPSSFITEAGLTPSRALK